MNDRSEQSARQRRFLAHYLPLLFIVGIAGSIIVHVVMQKGRCSRSLRAARNAGYPTTFAELAEYTKLPSGVENAAELYMQAFAVYVSPMDEVNLPVLGRAERPEGAEPMSQPMTEAVSRFLEANRECLLLLQKAAGTEHCRYDWDYANWMEKLPHVEAVKPCSGLLELAAMSYAEKGEAEAALGHVAAGLRLSESLRREPGIVIYLVRLACGSRAISGIERVLNVLNLTDEQLVRMGEAVRGVSEGLDFHHVMVTEQCLMIELCREPLRMEETRHLRPFFGLVSDQGLRDTLAYGGGYVEAAALPSMERLAKMRAIDRDLEDLSFFWHMFVKLAAPMMARSTELDLRVRARLDLARTALAIERYRLAFGQVPDQLESLVPQYLGAVPTDPFDGQPVRYRRLEPGYLLYSIMEDGQDNGGRTRDDVKRGEPYDTCFIVAR